ncbi:adenylate cyclase, putative [Trichomonas vaginalis G3]|uniref:Adenylate cyclase, putative n=1 Tax=Trichomonas vaginalis (strain ATCC PRA-98 / G3) TaxID=412133 RepID=A2FZC8_TRIV3|nr:guanylate cyclase protein [Trichomonas vaginalis G3]EAX89734.1 adenylate cyclase, putative [Trichomonas vaginalis G3]KAI5496109.1 guanylate cyclase protein [Trichomonas vaginalis G3]|eukprot:XP_001302664.1 adenylate cyclase [Trichomonas vaginalis G3]
MTTKSLGIRARKNFDFFVFTESENKLTPFSGVFIPLQNCNFALILKDQSEIIEMKDELDRLHKQISLVLKRLVHPMIAMKTVLDEMPNLTTKEKCVIFCCQMKTIEYVKPEIELFDYEITEVCISIFDRLLSKYNKICRMRTFNEDFVFIGGFFDDDSPGERIEEIIKFAQDAANDINHFLECNILLSGSINYGGPVHCGFSGISKTMFDYWSKAIIDCYDILDVVPPGKLLLFEDAYNYINDKSLFIPYRPTREIEQNLFIMQSYLGMGFTD